MALASPAQNAPAPRPADGARTASGETRGERSQSAAPIELADEHTSWFHPFACQWFHVLFNSLFKVLCNFPSRYLFAIGLAVIFSLRWSLPPALGCTLKQPDSRMSRSAHACPAASMGLTPTLESCSKELETRGDARCTATLTPHLLSTPSVRTWRWARPCSLAATKGIPFGFFSSA